MRRLCLAVLIIIMAGIAGSAQSSPPPQSARQALIEMFMSKNGDDFAKHLPDLARQSLIHKGETPDTSVVLRIATLGRGLATQGEHIETFDVGPNILVNEQPDRHERFEVAVEHDSLMGDQDEIELSIHNYKDGQEQMIPVVPRLIFTMKQEKDIWKLIDLTVAAHVPLTDPDYLKGLRKQQNEANENAAQMRVNMIVSSQAQNSAAHPEVGYTCSLLNMAADNPAGTPSNEPGQGSEESNGYRFTLSGCAGTPSKKYRLTAAPIDQDAEQKTFCADESGQVKFVTGGKPSSCFSSGQLVDTVPPPANLDE